MEIKTNTENEYFFAAESIDGLYHWNVISPDYVGIDCTKTALPDNTMGNKGLHVIYLQYPGDIDTDLLAGAREFKAAVMDLRDSRRQARENVEIEKAITQSYKAPKGIAGVHRPCPKCGTYCCGDCEASR